MSIVLVYIVLLIIISAGTIMIGELSGPDYNVKSFLISVILLIINFLNFYLYDKYIENMQMKIKFNAVESSNQAYKNQIQLMNESQKKIRLLKHDMKNHFLSINILADRNNDTDVINYITNIIEDLSPSERIIHTGNYMIDGLFNYFISIANNNNIHTQCDVSFPSDLIINEHDITILLGNLWDNCIENAMTCINGSIHFNLNYNKNRILLSCDNSFSGPRERIGSSFLSTKANKALHGIGLKNVKQIVDKYKGTINFDINNNIFSVKIIMYCK